MKYKEIARQLIEVARDLTAYREGTKPYEEAEHKLQLLNVKFLEKQSKELKDDNSNLRR